MATEPARTYPSELPVVPLRQTVVFPLTLQPLSINRPVSIEAVNRALAGDRLIFLPLQNNEKDEPEPADLRTMGTIAAIRQMAKVPNGGIHIIVEGLVRARATEVTTSGVSMRATVSPAPDVAERTLEIEAYVRRLHELIDRALSLSTGLSQELRGLVAGIDDPAAARLSPRQPARHEGRKRSSRSSRTTRSARSSRRSPTRSAARIALLEMKSKIESAAQQEMTDAQRQYYLRQQLQGHSRRSSARARRPRSPTSARASPTRSCPRRSTRSPRASSIAWSG
jgi:ATP-dependent Lon protease